MSFPTRRCCGRRRLRHVLPLTVIPLVLVSLVVTFFILPLPPHKLNQSVGDDVMRVLPDHNNHYINKKGVHVIVGHYRGKGYSWDGSPNLTDAFLNQNNYSPVPQVGENGVA
ncbi:unnamed protein product, partial [Oppiella nova]